MTAPFSVLVPVGPSADELERAGVLLGALYRHEPDVALVVLVDDEPRGRSLPERLPAPPHGRLVAVANPRGDRVPGNLGGLCAGVMAGLRAAREALPHAAFCLRLDTDALVIAPFADRVVPGPGVGIAGSYDDAGPDGRRDFGVWEPHVRRAARGRLADRLPPRRGHLLRRRALIAGARANGYRWGESCLAAACAISGDLLRALDLDEPLTWLHGGLGDDVMLGILARAHGYGFRGLTGDGAPLAVAVAGLNDTPEGIRAKGRAIVHSVRNDPRWDEAELRARLLG